MSVVFPIQPSDRISRVLASASQVMLAVSFPLQNDVDLSVRYYDVDGSLSAPLVLGSDYIIVGAGDPAGSTVKLLNPASVPRTYLLIGDAVLDRITSIVTAGMFASKSQDSEHDRHRLIQQELKRETGRAVKVAYGYNSVDLVPAPGKYLGWNEAGLTNLEPFAVGAVNFGAFGLATSGLGNASEFANLYAPAVWTGGRPQPDLEVRREVCRSSQFNIDHSGVNTSNAGIKAWLKAAEDNGAVAEMSRGKIVWDVSEGELYLGRGRALDIRGQGMGLTRKILTGSVHTWKDWVHQSTLAFRGNGVRYKNSRRKPSEPVVGTGDDPQSIAFHNIMEGTRIRDICFMQDDVNWADTAVTSLGGDIDHIFYSRRTDLRMDDVAIIGYGRIGTLTLDVTGHRGLPEFTDPHGFQYPTPSVADGVDNFRGRNMFVYGAKGWPVFIRGAIAGSGAYFDPISGQTVGDLPGNADDPWLPSTAYVIGNTCINGGNSYVCNTDHTSSVSFDATKWTYLGAGTGCRGTYGSSDFLFEGSIYNRHHSGLRLYNSPGALPDSDSVPAGATGCFYADGIAGNQSGAIQGVTVMLTRMSTIEEIHCRIGRVNRFTDFKCHYDAENTPLQRYSNVIWQSNTLNVGSLRGSANIFLATGPNKIIDGQYSILAGDAGQNDVQILRTTQVLGRSGGELTLNSGSDTDNVRAKVGAITKLLLSPTQINVYDARIGMGAGTSAPVKTGGNGSPEGAVTAVVGSEYSRWDAATNATRLYWKNSGTGNTGWSTMLT